jgi:DNA mismatch repair protein MutS
MTPFMRQYLEIKSGYPDAILFFRMGDFYELFLEDAKIAAPLMDVALTKRQSEIPMCGVPYHSAGIYIQRLLSAGKKVAIAEQAADPANPRLMNRRVVRVISAGTVIEDDLLSPGKSSYLMAVAGNSEHPAVALADISTGEFFALDASGDTAPSLRDIYYSHHPREILASGYMLDQVKKLSGETGVPITAMEAYRASPSEGWRRIEATFAVAPKALGFQENHPALGAVSLILHYIDQAFPEKRPRLEAPVFREPASKHLVLDEKTIRNLNLFEPAETSLLSLFSCRTAPGRRALRDFILHPLIHESEINDRLNAVEYLLQRTDVLRALQEALGSVFDLERILARIDGGRCRPADFRAVISTVRAATDIENILRNAAPFAFFKLDPSLIALADALDAEIVEEPAALPGASPFLREGRNPALDEAKKARSEGARWILELEEKERNATGIATLKIRFNRVTGYYIEVSKGQTQNVPDRFERKQTLVTGERYTTQELKEIERRILSAEAVIEEAELAAFERLVVDLQKHRTPLRRMMQSLATVDVLVSFAQTAIQAHWVRPEIVDTGEITLEQSRHPVVEKFLPAGVRFTPNDVHLNRTDRSFALLTGPNMAGKSTYIRQVALIQLLSQIGSFVPARRARITPVDRIFTRIGAQDDLARGESTFFVEMLETSAILRRFTPRSLIIMDEVGRGTSTYDGLSIAWAIAEYLTEGELRPAVLFATHYQELTALEERKGVINLTMDVHESDDRVIFLHRVKEGVADRSYGIHVARLAGLPGPIVSRAAELLRAFEERRLRESEALQLRETSGLEWNRRSIRTDTIETNAIPVKTEANEQTHAHAEETGRNPAKKQRFREEDAQGTLF